MSFLFSADYYEVRKNGISPAQNMAAYLGGSAIQTVGDNPVTAYRQLVQQYAKGLDGQAVDPKVATSEANAVFMKNPLTASLSGLWPRLIGVLFKRIPKFGILLGYGVVTGDKSGKPGFGAATAASILSAPFINPVRMVEKQQRAYLKQTGPARGGRRRRHAHGQTGWLGRGRVEARVERRLGAATWAGRRVVAQPHSPSSPPQASRSRSWRSCGRAPPRTLRRCSVARCR